METTTALAGAPASLPDADAELIRLAGEAFELDGNWLALDSKWANVFEPTPASTAAEAEIDRILSCKERPIEHFALMPAHTADGMRAKAWVLATYFGATATGDFFWHDHGYLLAWSLARDLLGPDGVPTQPREAAEHVKQ